MVNSQNICLYLIWQYQLADWFQKQILTIKDGNISVSTVVKRNNHSSLYLSNSFLFLYSLHYNCTTKNDISQFYVRESRVLTFGPILGEWEEI